MNKAVCAPPLIRDDDGTPEAAWLPWLSAQAFAPLDLDKLIAPLAAVLMVAPHPDDEILAAGGLLVQLAQRGHRIRILAVTDGTASHPGSSLWTPARLAAERPLESQRALRRLGLCAELVRLGLPDGQLQRTVPAIADHVAAHCAAGDLVLTTWRGDGHPDHEATAVGARLGAQRRGGRLLEVPVWAWHWARPGDPRVPWHRARCHTLNDGLRQRKSAALGEFRSQLSQDSSLGRGPVVRASMVERASRPFEVVLS